MKVIDRILLILILLTVVGASIFLYKGFTNNKSTTTIIEKQVDSLNNKRDSIKTIINNRDSVINNNFTTYVKERDNIISQSPDSDMQYFTNYIREVGRKLLIDTISIKDN